MRSGGEAEGVKCLLSQIKAACRAPALDPEILGHCSKKRKTIPIIKQHQAPEKCSNEILVLRVARGPARRSKHRFES
jgi:hypothetical protein